MLRRLIVLVSALTLLIPSAVLAQNPSQDRSDSRRYRRRRHRLIPSGAPQRPQRLPPRSPSCSRCAAIPSPSSSRRRRTRSLSKAQAAARSRPSSRLSQDAIKGQHRRRRRARRCRSSSPPTTASRSSAPRNKAAALATPAERHRPCSERPGRSSATTAKSVPFLGIPGPGLGSRVRGPRVRRRRHQDRRHRHGHRLHARELRRTRGPRRFDRLQRTTTRRSSRCRHLRPTAPKVIAGHRLRRQRLRRQRRRSGYRETPVPTPIRPTARSRTAALGTVCTSRATATGLGVLDDGTTYPRPLRRPDTHSTQATSTIGPGVAPGPPSSLSASSAATARPRSPSRPSTGRSDHVHGESSTCRSAPPFGSPTIPPPSPSTNAAAAGVSVVTSAGNSGPSRTSPAPRARHGLDRHGGDRQPPDPPGVSLDLTPGDAIDAIVANGITPADGTTTTSSSSPTSGTAENEALGCSVEAYTAAGIVEGGGQLAVTERGDVRPGRPRHLRPAGRCRCRGDDQQRRQLPAVRGADPLEPR